MIRAIPGTLLVAATFLVVAAAFTGIGLAVRRAFGLRELETDDCFVGFWMGFAWVLLFLLTWNFAFPIGDTAFALVLAAGMGGLFLVRREIRALAVAHTGRTDGLLLLGLFGIGLWIANLATGSMSNWDTSLYHMQGVRWAATYPAVPGLANLFGPLAFNNATFLYSALLDVGPWEGRAWHVANGVLVFVGMSQALVSGARLRYAWSIRGAGDLFLFLTLAPVISMATRENLRSFSPDLALTLMRLATITLWYRMLVRERRGGASEAYDLVCLVTLSAAAVATKMNAVVFAAVLVMTAGVLWYRQGGLPAPHRGRTLAWGAAIAICFGLAWAGRGVVLSGYPAFPSPMLAAPVEWRAPTEHARAEFDYVVHSTRNSSGNLAYVAGERSGFREWVPRWLRRTSLVPYNFAIPLALAVLLLPSLVLRSRRPEHDPDATRRGWWILFPAAFAIVSWFAVAPAPRYLAAIFWALPALLAAQAYRRLTLPEPWGRRALLAALALGLSPIVVNPLLEWRRGGGNGNPVLAILLANLQIPQPGQWFRGLEGHPELRAYQTSSGLVVNVPKGRCWDAPLPCTPNPAPNLRLREPGNLARGFVVDGEWQMTDWPEPWKVRYRAAWERSRAKGGSSDR